MGLVAKIWDGGAMAGTGARSLTWLTSPSLTSASSSFSSSPTAPMSTSQLLDESGELGLLESVLSPSVSFELDGSMFDQVTKFNQK